MADVAVQTLSVLTGTAPTFAAAASGDTLKYYDHAELEVKNTNASSMTVDVPNYTAVKTGVTVPAKQYTVAANTGEVRIPILPENVDTATNTVPITYSSTTNVTRAYVRVP